MAKNDNLTDFLTDVADAIREKEDTEELISPQDFSTRIRNLPTGGGGTPYVRPSDWLTIPKPSGDNDDIYILNGVIKGGLNKIFFELSGTGTIDWGDGNTQTFTSVSNRKFSHQYDYDDISSLSWTEHNMARQVLVHISGNRGAITKVNFAVQRYFINADGVEVAYNINISSDIYEIKANVNSAYVVCCNSNSNYHRNLEIFDWVGSLTNTSMSSMFNNCSLLQSIPQLDTSKAINMSYMFDDCSSLQTIPQLDTSRASNMTYMFSGCSSLQTIPQLNTSNATSINNMFGNCRSLQSIPQLDTSKATVLTSMFSGCSLLQTIPQLDTSNATDISYMFSSCSSLQSIPKLNTSNATNMVNMFNNCYLLQTIPQLDTSNATSMANVFNGCRSLQSIPQLNTGNATNMVNMFSGCSLLQSIPQLNTSKVTGMSSMFYSCYLLQTIPQLDTSKVTSMNNAFGNCHSLQKLKLYNLNPTSTSSITVSNLSNSTMMTKQALVDLFNSVPASPSGTRTIQLGTTLQGRLANCYVKDSGNYYTAIIPTSDTSIQSGKTYYTYDRNTDTYTQVTPDFTTDTFYYEGVTATWNEYVICESTDEGAVLALTYITNKGYTIT